MQTVIDSNWTLSLLHFSMLCVHARARAFSLARSFPLLLANFTRSLSHPPSMFFSLPIPRLRGGPRCSFRKRILSNSTFTDRYLSWRLRHSGMICGVWLSRSLFPSLIKYRWHSFSFLSLSLDLLFSWEMLARTLSFSLARYHSLSLSLSSFPSLSFSLSPAPVVGLGTQCRCV